MMLRARALLVNEGSPALRGTHSPVCNQAHGQCFYVLNSRLTVARRQPIYRTVAAHVDLGVPSCAERRAATRRNTSGRGARETIGFGRADLANEAVVAFSEFRLDAREPRPAYHIIGSRIGSQWRRTDERRSFVGQIGDADTYGEALVDVVMPIQIKIVV